MYYEQEFDDAQFELMINGELKSFSCSFTVIEKERKPYNKDAVLSFIDDDFSYYDFNADIYNFDKQDWEPVDYSPFYTELQKKVSEYIQDELEAQYEQYMENRYG